MSNTYYRTTLPLISNIPLSLKQHKQDDPITPTPNFFINELKKFLYVFLLPQKGAILIRKKRDNKK